LNLIVDGLNGIIVIYSKIGFKKEEPVGSTVQIRFTTIISSQFWAKGHPGNVPKGPLKGISVKAENKERFLWKEKTTKVGTKAALENLAKS
jgi:hypothetical protein